MEHCCNVILESTGDQLKAKNVIQEYLIAQEESFKEETITQAGLKSGIGNYEEDSKQKCNATRFTSEDFTPSVSTLTGSHLPEGYPDDLHGDAMRHLSLTSSRRISPISDSDLTNLHYLC
jgi:hypothetical protein